MKKIIKISAAVLFLLLAFFFVGKPLKAERISWGVNFSQKHAEALGTDWKESYSALIDDLGAENIKLAVYWDLIEPRDGEYDFSDLDWQIEKAEEKGADIFLAIGMKAPRWPECHFPQWAKGMEKEEQQEEIMEMLEAVVERYKNSSAIKKWQVENEPFFPFGECQWTDKEFLKKEVSLVRSLDGLNRPIVISDSGEGSFWIQAAKIGDMVATTMYRKVWVTQIKGYLDYRFPAVFYWRKAELIRVFFGKKVICSEFQAEPWGPELLYSSPLSEQEKTMNLEQFRKNIDFAEDTGLDEFYLWGSEWWYWMKEKQDKPEIWNEAKTLFNN